MTNPLDDAALERLDNALAFRPQRIGASTPEGIVKSDAADLSHILTRFREMREAINDAITELADTEETTALVVAANLRAVARPDGGGE